MDLVYEHIQRLNQGHVREYKSKFGMAFQGFQAVLAAYDIKRYELWYALFLFLSYFPRLQKNQGAYAKNKTMNHDQVTSIHFLPNITEVPFLFTKFFQNISPVS